MVYIIQPPDDEDLDLLAEVWAQQLRARSEQEAAQFVEQIRELAVQHPDLGQWASALVFDALSDAIAVPAYKEALFRRRADWLLHGEEKPADPMVIEGTATKVTPQQEEADISDQESKEES